MEAKVILVGNVVFLRILSIRGRRVEIEKGLNKMEKLAHPRQ